MIANKQKKYNIIYADPPWHYYNRCDKTASRWVGNKYPVMSIDDICKLPIQNICADDCILFLWVTAPILPEAFKVIEAWGFTYKTKGFCWVKKNKKSNSFFWGMGYWTRANTEDCLLAVKGKPKKISASVHQLIYQNENNMFFNHQIIESPIEQHSKKPDIVRDKIVKLVGDLPRIELFAREKIEGWDVWGNEIKSDILLEL